MNSPKLWYSRGYLPHFDGDEIIQFITFRLADSLPQKLLEKWTGEIEREQISEIEVQRKIEKYLDGGYGKCYLKNKSAAETVEETLLKFDGVRYELFSWTTMPNHVHLLLRPKDGFSLAEIMHSIKSYTAHTANKILNRKGRFWSKEYFDRFIRNQEHFNRTVFYTRTIP